MKEQEVKILLNYMPHADPCYEPKCKLAFCKDKRHKQHPGPREHKTFVTWEECHGKK